MTISYYRGNGWLWLIRLVQTRACVRKDFPLYEPGLSPIPELVEPAGAGSPITFLIRSRRQAIHLYFSQRHLKESNNILITCIIVVRKNLVFPKTE